MMKARSMFPNLPTHPVHYFPRVQAVLEENANRTQILEHPPGPLPHACNVLVPEQRPNNRRKQADSN